MHQDYTVVPAEVSIRRYHSTPVEVFPVIMVGALGYRNAREAATSHDIRWLRATFYRDYEQGQGRESNIIAIVEFDSCCNHDAEYFMESGKKEHGAGNHSTDPNALFTLQRFSIHRGEVRNYKTKRLGHVRLV